MTSPLYLFGSISQTAGYVAALLLGIGFGFVLERAGFADSRNLTNIFYFRDMRVLRVMFSAIVTTLVGLTVLSWLKLFDYGVLLEYSLLKTYLWPQLVGGIFFGLGFVVGGYCPGTAVVGITSGKLDSIVFVGGLMLGIFVFAAGFPIWGGFYKSAALGRVTLWQAFGLSRDVMTLLVVIMAFAAFYLAKLGEKWAPYGK